MTGPGGMDKKEVAELSLTPADLRIGVYVDVYGRSIHLRSCDAWTREWYASEEAAKGYGVTPQPDNITIEEEVAAPKPFVPPPHNGIGSEEDSLQSCYTFNVKPLRKDYTKWASYDGVSYKFTAKLVSSSVLDANRRFVVVLYPADDTMCVYESNIKNSGFKGGVFLRRDKHRKADGTPYVAADFAIGATAVIVAHKFLVVDADEPARAA